MSTEVYSVANDTLNGIINVISFQDQVTADSGLATKLDYFDVFGDVISLFFTPDLTVGEQSTLSGIVAAHDGTGPSFESILAVEPGAKSKILTSPSSSEDVTICYTTDYLRITKIVAVLIGNTSPSVTWTIRYSDDRNAAGTEVITSGVTTTNTTTGHVITVFDNPSIPENSFVWLETTDVQGTVDEFSVTLIP